MEQIKERPEQSESPPRTGLFRRTENVLSYVILSLLSVLPVAEVIVRKVFRTGVPAYTDYTIHLVLWITFIGGMITSRERRHLALAAGLEALKEPIREKVRVFNSFLAVMMTTAFFWSSLSFVIIGFTPS
ncbi:MAG: TRAP transporter small permease, partial [Spirochaetia bacterium]